MCHGFVSLLSKYQSVAAAGSLTASSADSFTQGDERPRLRVVVSNGVFQREVLLAEEIAVARRSSTKP
jgi:hypothetical protein